MGAGWTAGRIRARLEFERILVGAASRLEGPAQAVLGRARIRALLRRRALRAWRATDAPLILCYGNINRSAFAAEFARARGRADARSAGFYPEEGRPAPPTTVACAATHGVNLAGHRSRRVTGRDLAAAQAIFVFDLENLVRVGVVNPPALARTHLLGVVDDDPDVLISDPHGRGQDVLEQTVARIARAMDRTSGAGDHQGAGTSG